MAGPLHWFRKNQKLMLSVFGVGLMIVFTFSSGIGNDPLIDWFTDGSAVRTEDSVVVQWSGGELQEQQLEQLRFGRSLLARFLGTVQQIASERGGIPSVAMLPLYGGEQSLVELELLTAKANELGIEVGDAAVVDYLNQLTDGTVSPSEYRQLLRDSTATGAGSQLSEAQLFRLMSRELKAQKVRDLVQSGGSFGSPLAAWDYFNRLNRLVRAELMPISVDDYLAKVDDPSEAEIAEMYEAHKDDFFFPLSPDPGFRRREQRAFQFVKVDYDALLEIEKLAVSDEEIAQYYEENKEQYRKQQTTSGADAESDDPFNVPNVPGVDRDVEVESDTSKASTPALDPAGNDADSDSEPENQTETPATDDADSTNSSEETPAQTEDDAESTTDSNPDPAPTALPQDTETEAAADPQVEEAKPAAPASDEAGDDASADAPVTAEAEVVREETAIAEDEVLKDGSVDDVTETSADDVTETSADDETQEADADTTDVPAADATGESVTDVTDVNETPFETADESDANREPPVTGADTTAVESSDLDPVIFQPLADVKDDIRQSIASPRAQVKMDAIINDVIRALEKYHNSYTIWDIERDDNPNAEKPPLPDLSDFADGDRVVVGEIPLIDVLESQETEIGKEFDFRLTPQGGIQRITFAETAFSDKTSLYSPQVFPDGESSSNRYVYWMIDQKDEYVPDLDEVRAEVVRAIKRQRALEFAVADAERLADKATKQDAKLSATLSDRENAQFIDTGEISWVTAPMMEGSPPRIGAIPGAEDAGAELRESLFRLAPGEVAFATNMPNTKVYVFRVEDVSPTTELRREQFLRNGIDRSVAYLAEGDRYVGMREWLQDLEEQYEVEWKRDPRDGRSM